MRLEVCPKCVTKDSFLTVYHIVQSLLTIHKNQTAHAVKHSHAYSLQLSTPPKTFFFYSLKSRGICQPQTELIALNHSRSLKVSDRGDVITGVAEVAWESSEILGLTSLQCCIQIRLINHPFTADFVNTGIDLGERFGPEM